MRIITAALLAFALASAGAALSLPTSAVAEEPRTFIVQFQDLDLGSHAGRTTLERRVKWAARRACGSVPPAGLREMSEVAGCQKAARTDAMNQITATAQSGQVRGAR